MNDNEKKYYRSMINVMRGLIDDLNANYAPQEAVGLLFKLIEVCEGDYQEKLR